LVVKRSVAHLLWVVKRTKCGQVTTGAPKTSAEHDAHWGQMREHVLAEPGVAGAAFCSDPVHLLKQG
jgi:hypothetical protein